jgi:hypothetical protein
VRREAYALQIYNFAIFTFVNLLKMGFCRSIKIVVFPSKQNRVPVLICFAHTLDGLGTVTIFDHDN